MKKLKLDIITGLAISIICLILSLNRSFFYADIYATQINYLFILSKEEFFKFTPITYIFTIVFSLVVISYVLRILFPKCNDETMEDEKAKKNFIVYRFLNIFNFVNSIFTAIVLITFLLWVTSSIMYLKPYWNIAYNNLSYMDKVGMWLARVVLFTAFNIAVIKMQIKLFFERRKSKKVFLSGLWVYGTVTLIVTQITFLSFSDYMDELAYRFFGLRTVRLIVGDVIMGDSSSPINRNYAIFILTATALFGVFTYLSLSQNRRKISIDH